MTHSDTTSTNTPGRMIASRIAFLVFLACGAAVAEWIWIPGRVLKSLPEFSSRVAVFFLMVCILSVMAILTGLIWGGLISILTKVFGTESLYAAFKARIVPTRERKSVEEPAVSGLFCLCLGLGIYSIAGTLVFQRFYDSNFQNHALAALLTVVASLAIAAVTFPLLLPVHAVLSRLLIRIREKPWGRNVLTFDNALIFLAIVVVLGVFLALVLFWDTVIQIKDYEFYLFLGGVGAGFLALQPVWWRLRDRATAIDPALRAWPVLLVLAGFGMAQLSNLPSARFVVTKRSPLSAHVFDFTQVLLDFDRDGYPAILGGGDCNPFDSKVYPDALEIPGNGVDDNCFGGDRPRRRYRNPDRAFDVPEDFRKKNYNILLISVDATRARNVSWHGYKRDTTPNIARWIEERNAFVFERAYCNVPATRWVIPQIHSSLYPSDIQWSMKTFPHTVKRQNLMLAEVLQKHGFYTAAYWTMDKRRWGQNQGFDRFIDNGAGDKISGDRVTKYAKKFLDKNNGERFFLWLHYFEPHAPYQNHKEFDYGNRDIDRYDEEISFVDHQIDLLFKELKKRKLWEKTIVILTADHGEEFKEHGKRFHSYHLYEESVHVPLVWWIPELSGKRFPHTVDHMDLMPTILNLFGYRDGWTKFRGRSYASLFFGEDGYAEHPVFLSISWVASAPKGSIRGVVDRGHKLLYNVQSQVFELYDLEKDPLESHNIFDGDHPAAKRLMPALQHEMDEISPNKTFH